MMTNRNSSNTIASNPVVTVKFLILTVVLAITIGLWGFFSRQSREEGVLPATKVVISSTQIPSGIGLDLPPIPTLVPLENVSNNTMNGGQVPPSDLKPNSGLRQIVIPTVVKGAPQKPIVVRVGGGGGGGGGEGGSVSAGGGASSSSGSSR
jgi:uncharacterized membrane protein YgcG